MEHRNVPLKGKIGTDTETKMTTLLFPPYFTFIPPFSSQLPGSKAKETDEERVTSLKDLGKEVVPMRGLMSYLQMTKQINRIKSTDLTYRTKIGPAVAQIVERNMCRLDLRKEIKLLSRIGHEMSCIMVGSGLNLDRFLGYP